MFFVCLCKKKKKKKSGSGYWLCEEENNVLFLLSILFLWNSSRKTARPCMLLLKKKITKDTEHVQHYLSAKLAFAAEQVRPSSFYSHWEGIGPFSGEKIFQIFILGYIYKSCPDFHSLFYWLFSGCQESRGNNSSRDISIEKNFYSVV